MQALEVISLTREEFSRLFSQWLAAFVVQLFDEVVSRWQRSVSVGINYASERSSSVIKAIESTFERTNLLTAFFILVGDHHFLVIGQLSLVVFDQLSQALATLSGQLFLVHLP